MLAVGGDDLLVRLARAIATTPLSNALSERLCLACRDLAGADAAALTLCQSDANRMTLFATDETASRIEDLQDVLGQGPGHSAAMSGQIEVCSFSQASSGRWPQFGTAALELVGDATLHAVPMQPGNRVLGILSLYQTEHDPDPLALPSDTLLRLAAATGAALVRDPDAMVEELTRGPGDARARVHQATGMVVVQLGIMPEDALAVLKAHAYAGETTLDEVVALVLDRTLRFHPSPEGGPRP